ncbi:hypothetical protein HK100_001065 [Physocladia obscura]|uniref:FAD-binding domain-containing protein n=1 Tax=Physocladia obscura TaxID=109957 RepID=A0AAD5SXB4_9FUNG|nr:hypothetical protein HK100_001065 [Physocladia obscura]
MVFEDMPSVIVIGAGPVGAATALGLQQRGFDVRLFDRIDLTAAMQEAQRSKQATVRVEFSETPGGGGVSLSRNGLTALETLGVLEPVLRCPHVPVAHFSMMKADGTDPINHFALRHKAASVKQFLRHTLHTPILKACSDAGIKITVSKKLVHVVEIDGGVRAEFADGTVATADFLIGADGIHSVTRRIVFPETPKPKFWSIGYIGVFERGQVVDGVPVECDEVMGLYNDQVSGNFIFTTDCSEKYGSWMIMQVDKGPANDQVEDDEWRPYTDLPTESKKLAGVVEGWGVPQSMVNCVRFANRITPVSIYDLHDMSTFSKGRVLLVGDAAHGTIPTIGQGLNTGFEDAAVLSDLFAEFPASNAAENYKTVFELYDKIRLPRVRAIYLSARDVGTRMKAKSEFQARVGRFMMRTVFSLLSLFGVGDVGVYDYRKDVEKVLSEYRATKH